jgi:hypothetical protein
MADTRKAFPGDIDGMEIKYRVPPFKALAQAFHDHMRTQES